MSHSISRVRYILDESPKIFREAIENMVDKWSEGDVDVSCIVTALIDARDQIAQIDFEKEELEAEVNDLKREVQRLSIQVKMLSEVAIVISQSQKKAD